MTEDLKKRIQQLGYELAARGRQASQAIAELDAGNRQASQAIAELAARNRQASQEIAAQQQGIDAKLDEILEGIANLQAAIAKLQTAAKKAVGAST